MYSFFYPSVLRSTATTRFSNTPLPPNVQKIVDQLTRDTGRTFPIAFLPQHDVARAHMCTQQIEISRCYIEPSPYHVDPPLADNVMAGVIAHEWGHLIDNLSYSEPSSRQREYKADVFAAQFLARHGYPIDDYIAFCIKRPQIPGDPHGTHAERSSSLRNTYYATLGGDTERFSPLKYTQKCKARTTTPWTVVTPMAPAIISQEHPFFSDSLQCSPYAEPTKRPIFFRSRPPVSFVQSAATPGVWVKNYP